MSTNFQTNKAKAVALEQIKNLGPKLMLVTSSYTPDRDHHFASSATAYEITASGYTGGYGGAGRKALANMSVVLDDTGDTAYLTADPASWTALGATGTSPTYALVIIESGGSDATSPLLAVLDAAQVLSGGTFTITASATGFIKLVTG